MLKFRLKFLIPVFLLLVGFSAQAYYELGQPTGFVNDFADIFSQEQKINLETKISQFEKESSNEISVVTINSLEGDVIENFGVKLFEDWGIGKKDKDNGVLLLIAIEDRKMRIEVGYGLEGSLTDIQSKRIITDILTPTFKNADYYNGTSLAIDRMIAVTKGEYTAEAGAGMASKINARNIESYFWLIIFGFYLLVALKRYLAKSRSWWEGGVIGAILGAIISLIFFSSFIIFSIIFFAAAGLGFDFMVSRFKVFQNKPGKKNNFWFFGGPRGGSGGPGGGFGGFGGGFSGGGGSSGSW